LLQTLITTLALLPAVPSAVAKDAAIDNVVVTAKRRSVDVKEISSSVSIASADEVINQKLSTDALRSLVGLTVQQTTPGQGAAIVRGLKGSAVLHIVDGMRLNNGMFRTAPTPWFALVPAVSVERLEVVRGTPASLYGSEAVGGVVQSVSRMPEFKGDNTEVERDVVISFDSAELQKSVRATVDAGTRKLATSVSAEYLHTGDRRTGGGERVGPSGYISKALRGVVKAAPSKQRSWLLDIQYLKQPGTPRIDELVAGFGQVEPSSSEFVFAPNRRIFAHANYEYISDSTGIDWQFDAAWQQITDDRTTRDFGATERRFEENRSDLYGITANASGRRDNMSWIAGIDLYHDEITSSRAEQDINDGTVTVRQPRFPDSSTINQAGLFANAQWRFAGRHSLSAGIRYSDVTIDLPDGTSINPVQPSGDLGWITDITGNLQFVVNIGAGFRAPNIADLGTLGNRPGNRFNIPNTDLVAEDVTHGDLGLHYRSARLQFELLLFALRYTDRIVSVSTGGATPEGRDIVQSVNAASSSIRGIEAGIRFDPSNRLTIRAVLNYARGDQRVSDVEEPADRVPPLNGRFSVRYAFNERWSFESWLTAADRQDRLSNRDVGDVRIDPNGTPGWASVGANATWSPGGGWLLTAALDNVLDRKYRSHGSGIDAPGRNLYVSVRRRW
jgi:outer membrane receptor protein involved in Fe transport